jgi:uncharacterized membrane protein YedE/YeeE
MRQSNGPVLAHEFDLPDNDAITPRVVTGAAVFGVGWGLAGFCPGPGLTSLATLLPGAIVFVIGMFVGIALYKFGIKH